MLHYETISPHLLSVLKRIQSLPDVSRFRLVGGTSLSLQIGHRISVDIDLFTDKSFDITELQKTLDKTFDSFEVVWANKNGFVSTIDNIKVDFFDWHIPFIKDLINEDGICLAHMEDIGAMKLEAITSRKEKKDFIDIMFLLRKYSLTDLLSAHKVKYPYMSTKFVIESLLAVDFADNTEPPKMIIPYDWQNEKSFIIKTVNNYLSGLKEGVIKQQEDRIMKAEELLRKKNRKS
ncbi:MAG: nucleotidyl transferase AbiEii/AbiGii toxin family protein [Ginsengibacter sp.]